MMQCNIGVKNILIISLDSHKLHCAQFLLCIQQVCNVKTTVDKNLKCSISSLCFWHMWPWSKVRVTKPTMKMFTLKQGYSHTKIERSRFSSVWEKGIAKFFLKWGNMSIFSLEPVQKSKRVVHSWSTCGHSAGRLAGLTHIITQTNISHVSRKAYNADSKYTYLILWTSSLLKKNTCFGAYIYPLAPNRGICTIYL